MFGIGTVARLAGVSVRTLRYYDDIGLLHPAWTDPNTGYRWYEPDQLRRLQRILALRDLGVRLGEIALLLDRDLSTEELRGILLLRRAEAHDRMAAEAERLARVEARLAQMEEPTMTDYDVVVKATDPEWVIAITEELTDLDAVGPAHSRLWPRLHATLDEIGVGRTPPSIAVERPALFRPDDIGRGPIEFTAAVPVPDGTACERDGARTMQLPGMARAATTVMYGDDFHGGFRALRTWIEDAGEQQAGELREIYLDCDGPRDTWVVELQLAVQPRG